MTGLILPHEGYVDRLKRCWPNGGEVVVSEYAALGEMTHVLADIAIMGGVNAAPGLYADPIVMAQAEGARQLAMRIITQAGVDPVRLWDVIKSGQRRER
ncbi:MAG TPA: hypothetical protein PLG99_02690 [Kaistiaceae bacterium]|nr:hypothetical protein [Kaistiaceae bacterium]